MPHDTPNGWEPDPKMGNWRAMFDHDRGGKPASAPPPTIQREMPREQPPDEEGLALDLSVYKPWILQRGRARPAMMLHLRRYEPKSGLWMGWQLAYHTLIAAEYVGERMLSLDFGTRQFVIEGDGLDELARHLQEGTVLAVQEYAARIWQGQLDGSRVSSIRRLGDNGA